MSGKEVGAAACQEPTDPESDQNPFQRPHPARGLFREHPALAVSAAYLALSAVGIMFSFAFYREFDVNVFNFAEISDFLMAVLREPISLVLAAGAGVVLWLVRQLNYLEWRYFTRKPPTSAFWRVYFRMSRPYWGNPWVDMFVVVTYAFLFISLYTDWKADRIRAGEGQRVEVVVTAGGVATSTILLGATNRFVFLFQPPSGHVAIVPHESLDRLTVVPAAPPQPREGI